ncbi:innexin domain-containing protein [Ditylenchus destructor]|nr:innexin domain-containing protein [Ditylenchus destructor]
MQPFVNEVVKHLKKRSDDDAVDRINYFYTPMILGFLAMGVSLKQYVGEPLQCWVPAQFKDAWESYAERYCFVENTYFVSLNESFPRSALEREERQITYYQWVPFMLFAQMILLILPKMLWNAFYFQSGIHVHSIVQEAMTSTKLKKQGKHLAKKVLKKEDQQLEGVQNASHYLMNALNYNIERKNINKKVENPSHNYVTNLYLTFKFFNWFMVTGQLYVLNWFLSPEYSYFWGYQILVDLLKGRHWHDSGHFPRVTYCDIAVREQGGHLVPHTFQCVLMINMFIEKMYIFIWFWLVFTSIVGFCSFTWWLTQSINTYGAVAFVKRHIQLGNRHGMREKICDNDVDRFVRRKLCRDGVTILRLIKSNCGPFVTSQLALQMWNAFKEDEKAERDNSSYTNKMAQAMSRKQSKQSNPDATVQWPGKQILTQDNIAPQGKLSFSQMHPATPANTPATNNGLIPPIMDNRLRDEFKRRASMLGIPMEEKDELKSAEIISNGPMEQDWGNINITDNHASHSRMPSASEYIDTIVSGLHNQ